jgi:hypothetical protein
MAPHVRFVAVVTQPLAMALDHLSRCEAVELVQGAGRATIGDGLGNIDTVAAVACSCTKEVGRTVAPGLAWWSRVATRRS